MHHPADRAHERPHAHMHVHPACLQERLRAQAAAREVAEVQARAFKARPSPVKALAAQQTPPKPTPASPTQVRACMCSCIYTHGSKALRQACSRRSGCSSHGHMHTYKTTGQGELQVAWWQLGRVSRCWWRAGSWLLLVLAAGCMPACAHVCPYLLLARSRGHVHGCGMDACVPSPVINSWARPVHAHHAAAPGTLRCSLAWLPCV